MSIEVKLRRGTANQHSGFTGVTGEVTVDITNDTLRVHDGVLAGGHRLARYSELGAAGANTGMELSLATPTDGSLTNSAAYESFTTDTTVTDAIDILNQVINNVRNDTFIKSVTFTADATAGGAGTTVTLSTTVDGSANQFEIDWGDGGSNTVTSDSTPSHTYATNSGSPFTVALTARNTSGSGEGISAVSSRTDYITIYTATPAVDFGVFSNSVGGSALTGSNLYVIEGGTLHLDNDTTNIGSASVTYTVDWGDGTSAETVANDTSAGGTAGSRLSHTWGASTSSGTGSDTITLTLATHSTALPADIPSSTTTSLKVYDDSPSTPNGLSSKSITFSGSTGTSPRLASGFTDNTGGATYSTGSSVERTTSASGDIVSSTLSTLTYNAGNGTLSALVNGVSDGATNLTSSDQTGRTTSLDITSESDYNLFNASGSPISFSSSIYHPSLYSGFKARVAIAASGVSIGVNSMQLSHDATGSTNVVEFVKDDLTATPAINISTASVTESAAGSYRYISGIPYYNSGSPSLLLSGLLVDNLVGQCYTNQSNIFEVEDGTNQEGTSSSVVASSDYTYSDIDGSSTMLSGGVPVINVGTSSMYAIGNLVVPITSSNVRSISRLKARARNVNGVGSFSGDLPIIIQVHKSSQSGIVEQAISVSDSLGITYNDDGVRIFDFSAATTDTPTYTSSTNFYSNDLYSETSGSSVVGTKEATIRLGVVKHDVTDYSAGYLPAGPNRSGDTGTQYFTFAFRRAAVANFDINITSSGIRGLWIAAPGTGIDNASGLNGWIDSSINYNGSGVPGSDTSNGGNGSNGCALTGGDIIQAGTSLSGGYTMTLGSENMSNATSNVVLVRIALASGESISALSIGVAS
jgi:hypothetical protein